MEKEHLQSKDVIQLEDFKPTGKNKKDRQVAMDLVETIQLMEDALFNKKVKVNLFNVGNGWGVEASYHKKSMEYDIYVPELNEKFNEIYTLFPDKCLLKDKKKKLIFVAVHKVRHRIQIENDIKLLKTDSNPDDMLLTSIIETIRSTDSHNQCSCSFVENPHKCSEMEFDSMIIQHYILSRLGDLSSYQEISDIPTYIWNHIAEDLSIEE